MKYINYGKQSISQDDIREVTKTLRSNFLTTGPKINQFENKFSKYTGLQSILSHALMELLLYLAFKAIRLKKMMQ